MVSRISDARAKREDPLIANQTADAVDMGQHPICLEEMLGKPDSVTDALATAKASSNRQIGSMANTAGTTSAVSQPFDLASVASEYGGITTSTSNGTFTLQTSFDQPLVAWQKQGWLQSCGPKSGNWPKCLDNNTLDWLHRFSLSTTFNTSAGSKTVTATAVNAQQGSAQQVALSPSGTNTPALAAVSFKWVALNYKADGATAWAKAVASATDVQTEGGQVLVTSKALRNWLSTFKYYLHWQECTSDALSSATDDELATVAAHYYGQLYLIVENQPAPCGSNYPPRSKDFKLADTSALEATGEALATYISSVKKLVASITQPVLTFEYDYSRPQSQPANFVFRLIYSQNVTKNAATLWTITGNAAGSIFQSTPTAVPGARRLRDIQAAFEVDRVLPSVPLLGASSLGGAYYFQYQSSPGILNVTPGEPIAGITFVGLPANASQVFTQKGAIHVAQLRWGLGTGKSLKFPLAFSYSNRTELIVKPEWRAQFGISYDFSSLLNGTGSQ